MNFKIVLIKIDQRIKDAGVVQKVLTEHGCNIRVRLGLHEVSTDACAQDGLIILHVDGLSEEIKLLLDKLNSLEFVHANLTEM